ncbi:hypothetical protein [Spirosoma utsteinense]|uniref:Uncharacterized protein n=1 Tax=Spirosoma utsteinense TaxID=2585773 RepID=A0ABR6WET9_9BACT|nr:hypothetical protein [Spirosoma utsteinense]MBC3789156.1 hypothetical protein [Spirosoma utsteinense]MBC3795076.1 hypothetical protein [Spirosoma utsteinense]
MSNQRKVSTVDMINSKTLFLKELEESVRELNDVLAGNSQAQDAYELLDILDAVERRNEPTRPFEEVKNEILTSRSI